MKTAKRGLMLSSSVFTIIEAVIITAYIINWGVYTNYTADLLLAFVVSVVCVLSILCAVKVIKMARNKNDGEAYLIINLVIGIAMLNPIIVGCMMAALCLKFNKDEEAPKKENKK